MAPSPTSCFFLSRFYKSFRALSEHRIVSKPQILSRLRHVNIVERPDETEEEKVYRTHYDNLQDWNNRYWAENNKLFTRCKADYIKSNFGDIAEEEALSHDQLAPFYREFLELNREKHVRYNTTWYRSHLALLQRSIMAKLSRIRVNLAKVNRIKNVGNY